MFKTKIKKSNIIYLIVIVLFLIPQSRQYLQVLIHKGLAMFEPSAIDKSEQTVLSESDYNWSLKNKNDEVFNFKETKGKVVLVNFWATWCPPCIAEMPSIQSLHNDYKDKIEFVLISDEEFLEINAFLKKKAYSFNVYNPITDLPEIFDVVSIPRTFLIDKNGHIVMDETGAVNWNSESIREIINKLLL